MSLHEMPEHFVCDLCQERTHLDLWCTAGSCSVELVCVRCCGCEGHTQEVPGVVIYPWRGLARQAEARPPAPHAME